MTTTPLATWPQVATDDGFTALVAAADKAGLVPALTDATASLTVFAPTDAAFDTLATSLGFADAGAMVAALDGPTLAKILTYHVLPTRQDAAAIDRRRRHAGHAVQLPRRRRRRRWPSTPLGGVEADRRGAQRGHRHHAPTWPRATA